MPLGRSADFSVTSPATQRPIPVSPTTARLRRSWQDGLARAGSWLERAGFGDRQQWVPRARRAGFMALTLVLLAVMALTVAWQVTPSVSDLGAWVRSQDTTHHTPYTPISQISPWMARALVAIEDERFYQHHGIDTIGLIRAAWDDLRAGQIVEGGSTLTAQLAKNAYLQGNDHSIPRKLEDLLLAGKIESRYSKSQILQLYLNLVYFGQGAYGVAAAATRYFGLRQPSQLDLAQAALLAGLVQAPGYYDPWCHPSVARARQHTVLDSMVEEGMISTAQAQAAEREQFSFWLPGARLPNNAYCGN